MTGRANCRRLRLGTVDWDVFAVDVQKMRYGYILVRSQEPNGPLTDMQTIAVEHAVTVTALQLAREEAVSEARHSYKRDFLEDLIAGAVTNRELALTRGEAVGLRLNEPYYILAADIDGFTGMLAGRAQSELLARRMKNELLRLVEQAAAAWKQPAMTVSRSDSIVVVLPAGRRPGGDARKRLNTLAQTIQQQARLRWPTLPATMRMSAI